VNRAAKASQVPLALQDRKDSEARLDHRASEVTTAIPDSPEQPASLEDREGPEQLVTLGVRVQLEIRASLDHKVTISGCSICMLKPSTSDTCRHSVAQKFPRCI